MRPELIALTAAIVGIPGIVVALVALHRRQVGKRLEAAERLGFAYARDREGAARGRVLGGIHVSGRDRLVGTWRGRQARLDYARQSHGNQGSTDYTRAVLEGAAPAGVTMIVQRNSVGKRLAEAVGLIKDLKTGDEALDRTWQIQGNPESTVLSILRRPAIRHGLEAEPQPTALIARDGRLELLVRKTVHDPEQMRTMLDLASDLADAVSHR